MHRAFAHHRPQAGRLSSEEVDGLQRTVLAGLYASQNWLFNSVEIALKGKSMNFLFSFALLAAAFVLVVSGFLYLFDPPSGQRLLTTAAKRAAVGFAAIVTMSEFVRFTNPYVYTGLSIMLSAVAHYVRERRLGHSRSGQTLRRSERTPVLPQYDESDHK